MLVVEDGDPAGHGVRQGRAMSRLDADLVGVRGRIKQPVSNVNIAFPPVKIRLVADVVDKPARRITAVQRTLRPFQDFGAIDVKHGKGLGLGNGNIAFVEVHRGRRLYDVVKIILGGAPYGELGILAGEVSADVDAGTEGRNIKTFLNAQHIHLFAGESGNGDAYVLQALLPFLGRNHHLFQYPLRKGRVAGKHKQRCDKKCNTFCCCKHSSHFHVCLSNMAH